MQKLKTLIQTTVLAATLLFVATPALVAAVDVFPDCSGSGSGSTVCANKSSGGGIFQPGGLFSKVLQTVIFIVGSISVLMIVIGGLRYVLSGGDSKGIEDAKNTVLYAVIGLVVAISAQAILTFVLQRI